jgi:hypothetical protein
MTRHVYAWAREEPDHEIHNLTYHIVCPNKMTIFSRQMSQANVVKSHFNRNGHLYIIKLEIETHCAAIPGHQLTRDQRMKHLFKLYVEASVTMSSVAYSARSRNAGFGK